MQWSSWLRRTRREPPTLEELQKDYLRQVRLQENVHRLEQEYRAEKLRLAEANKATLLHAPAHAAVGHRSANKAEDVGTGGSSGAEAGLPADHGGVDDATAARTPEIARNVGLGPTSGPEQAAAVGGLGAAVRGGAASPEQLAERRRKEEEAEAAKRRAEFGADFQTPLFPPRQGALLCAHPRGG